MPSEQGLRIPRDDMTSDHDCRRWPRNMTVDLDLGPWPGNMTSDHDLATWTGSLDEALEMRAWGQCLKCPQSQIWKLDFAEFSSCIAENSAHAGSVILNHILSLDSGFIDDNSALHDLFCDLSTLLQSNLRVTKMLHLFAEGIYAHMRSSVWYSRFTHVPQRSAGTNFQLHMALLDNHSAKFLRT